MTVVGRRRPARPERHAEADDAAEAVGAQQRGVPGHRRAPVVAGDHRLLGTERIEQADHVADQVQQRVLVDRLRAVGLAVAAHVGRDGVVAGLRQRGELVAPGIPGLRKAVAQQHQRPVARSAMCMRMPLVSTVRWFGSLVIRLLHPAADDQPPIVSGGSPRRYDTGNHSRFHPLPSHEPTGANGVGVDRVRADASRSGYEMAGSTTSRIMRVGGIH